MPVQIISYNTSANFQGWANKYLYSTGANNLTWTYTFNPFYPTIVQATKKPLEPGVDCIF